jgi:hypothetical protein
VPKLCWLRGVPLTLVVGVIGVPLSSPHILFKLASSWRDDDAPSCPASIQLCELRIKIPSSLFEVISVLMSPVQHCVCSVTNRAPEMVPGSPCCFVPVPLAKDTQLAFTFPHMVDGHSEEIDGVRGSGMGEP